MSTEALFVIIVSLAALVPFAVLWRRNRLVAVGVPLVLGLLAFPLAGAWDARREEIAAAQAKVDVAVPAIHEEDGYVGSAACRSCHPGEHDSWHRTYHRTMTQRVSPETVLGDFDDRVLEDRGRAYRMERRGDEFWVELVDPDWDWSILDGRRPALPSLKKPVRVWRQVMMITGSHDTQVYWIPGFKDKRLNYFPLVWKIEAKQWIPLADAFLKDPESDQHLTLWNYTCLQCHATGSRSRPRESPGSNAVDMDTAVGELGISCEACHGPGAEHIRANESPVARYRNHLGPAGDPTIVNPARLPHDRSSEVCGQCHGMAWFKRDLDDIYRDGFAFRPGDDIAESKVFQDLTDRRQRTVFLKQVEHDPAYIPNHYWPDGMVRVSGRDFSSMRKSACYTKGEMSCLSCHSMHDSDPNDMLIEDMTGNQGCVQCHEDIGADVSAHTHHEPGSSGSSCYECHMPHVTYGLLKGIRNHHIASPTAREEAEFGRPNACNLCHLDQTLAWTQEHLSEWYETPEVPLDGEERVFASSVRLALKGDAAQRALIAFGMGLEEARKVSGEDWMIPVLLKLLEDPYGAVRYIAERSLRRFAGHADFEYDHLDPPEKRRAAAARLLERWAKAPRASERGRAVLRTAAGGFDAAAAELLLKHRNNISLELGE